MDTRAAPPFPHNGVLSLSLVPLRQLLDLMLPRADMWRVHDALRSDKTLQCDSDALLFAQQRAQEQSGNARSNDILAPTLDTQADIPVAAQAAGASRMRLS